MNYRLLCCINLIIFFSSNYEANASAANTSINSAATQARANSWENSNCIARLENLTPDRIAILNRLIHNRETPLYLDDVMTFEGLRYSDLLKENVNFIQPDTDSPQPITYDIQNRQIQIQTNLRHLPEQPIIYDKQNKRVHIIGKYILFEDIQKIVTDYYQIFLLKYGLQNSELLNLLEVFDTGINETAGNFLNTLDNALDTESILDDALDIESIIYNSNEPIRSCVGSNKNIYAFTCYAYVIHKLQTSPQERNPLVSKALAQNNAVNQNLILKFRTNNFPDFLKKVQNFISIDIKINIQNILTSPSFEEYLQEKSRAQDIIIIRDQIVKDIIEKVINDMKFCYDILLYNERPILRNFIRRYINLLTNERP